MLFCGRVYRLLKCINNCRKRRKTHVFPLISMRPVTSQSFTYRNLQETTSFFSRYGRSKIMNMHAKMSVRASGHCLSVNQYPPCTLKKYCGNNYGRFFFFVSFFSQPYNYNNSFEKFHMNVACVLDIKFIYFWTDNFFCLGFWKTTKKFLISFFFRRAYYSGFLFILCMLMQAATDVEITFNLSRSFIWCVCLW